jgi:hypothetical protein
MQLCTAFNLPSVSSVALLTIMTRLSVSGSGSILRSFVWQLKGIRRNTDSGRCTLYLGEEDVTRILLDCLEIRNCRTKYLNEKKLNVKKEMAYRKALD